MLCLAKLLRNSVPQVILALGVYRQRYALLGLTLLREQRVVHLAQRVNTLLRVRRLVHLALFVLSLRREQRVVQHVPRAVSLALVPLVVQCVVLEMFQMLTEINASGVLLEHFLEQEQRLAYHRAQLEHGLTLKQGRALTVILDSTRLEAPRVVCFALLVLFLR